MFALFHRKTATPLGNGSIADARNKLLQPTSAAALLSTPCRRKLIEHIWQRTSLSHAQFTLLYRTPIERYAALVQQFPASESHHHAYPGGMLDHGLEIVAYALKLRQSHLIPVGAPPETQAAQAEAWTAAAAYAALLHDVGKIAVDLHVEYADGERWHPWHGALQRPYRFRYRKDRAYRLHGAATGLLYVGVLDKPLLDWLSSFPQLWASLLYILAGQYEHAGILGDLVMQADRASVAQELGGDPAKARLAPKHALQRKLLEGLRYLIDHQLKLNQPEASDGWLTDDALWLVSKTVCDKLRAHLLSQGIEGVPEKNTAVFNVLQDQGMVQPTREGKAIWRATVVSESGWTQSFTFLKLAPSVVWETDERPAPFRGRVLIEDNDATSDEAATRQNAPSSAVDADSMSAADIGPPTISATADDAVCSVLALFDEPGSESASSKPHRSPTGTAASAEPLQDHQQPMSSDKSLRSDSAIHSDDPSGVHFLGWLQSGIRTRRLIINDAKALVHTVAGTVYLVSPGVFHRYVQEHPEIARIARQEKMADWEWTQKQFERLHMHRRQRNGLNIWTCTVTGPRKSRRLHGYLLVDGHTLFSEVPFDNPYLKLVDQSP